MITEAKAIKIITPKLVERWRDILGLNEWKLELKMGRLEDGDYGSCSVMPTYKKATITLNLAAHKTEKELLDTFRHEMIHIVHANFELYRSAVTEQMSPQMGEITDKIYALGAEEVVLKLENILEGLGVDLKGRIS